MISMKIARLAYAASRKVYYKHILPFSGKVRDQSPKDYYGKLILDADEGNGLIANYLEHNSPTMVCKIGSVELNCLTNYFNIQNFRQSQGIGRLINTIKLDKNLWNERVRYEIKNNAGVFPNSDEMLEKFATFFLSHIKNIDVLGVWFKYNEDFVFHNYCSKATLMKAQVLNPVLLKNPWTYTLKDKKVLVIHPYQASILKQYNKRMLLFEDRKILPKFELKTLKAIQSAAQSKVSFKDWFEVYYHLCNKIIKIDFDIALIGAGSYSIPLASFIKTTGKKAIHLGGETQILFGIKGRRWDCRPSISKFYNKHWVRPLPSETPQSYQKVENGCYW